MILNEFRNIMKKHNIDAYIIPTADFHQSEYVSPYFKGRSFITGFTGSAGTAVITLNDALLWTDGRYFIQAEGQIKSSGFKLMKMGQANVATIKDYLKENLTSEMTLGFDGRVVSTNEFKSYEKALECNIVTNLDLVDEIWSERPELPFSMLYYLDKEFSGEDSSSKIQRLRIELEKNEATAHILTSLEDQAWLFNLRANDVSHTPVFLSYTLITKSSITLFIDSRKLNNNVKDILNSLNIAIKPYNDIYDFAKELHNESILIDGAKVNSQIYNTIKDSNRIIFKQNPTLRMKAIKNEVELENTRYAHILDGVAVTKLMKYVKENVKNETITEIDASNHLESLRRENPSLLDLSFDTICAYKENAAMMHYSATSETNTLLKNEGMLLVDSGGHYLEGTTDITRTFSLGNPTDEEKLYFTSVLKGMIDLSSTVFLKGCTGQNLDIRAREPMWKMLIDYKCGTGHGVGHILSVHEAPNGIRWQIVPERNDSSPLELGMITTNEPGIYLEGKLGIRTENELICKLEAENEWGTFYSFETITFCPIDLDLVDSSLLTNEQKEWLNNYHLEVYEKLSPHLNDEEKDWLREYTKSI